MSDAPHENVMSMPDELVEPDDSLAVRRAELKRGAEVARIAEALRRPFPPSAIEWRVSRAMNTRRGPAATVLAYLQARAVMDRLDDIMSIENWRDQYELYRDGETRGVICHLSLRMNGQWVTKSDGAPFSDIESFKGGISDAFKRAAVKWGIGRYLYDLAETWVKISERKQTPLDKYCKSKDIVGYWSPPELPSWALPHE